jgi:dTDP-4-dehydrorhamnose reductase
MAIRILQFGTTGQLGLEISRLAEARSDIALRGVSQEEADFRHPEQVATVVRSASDIDAVINTVAYTAVDKAETDEDLARLINATSVATMADACAARAIPLIHVSTDYVFDGSKLAPYIETDATNPLGVYGRTKREGELAIEAASVRHAIVRTSWLYSVHGTNFVKTMLHLGREREELRIVDDQKGAPTSAANLADAILVMAQVIVREPKNAELSGIFHYADAGETTWRHFAEVIFAASGLHPRVIPVLSKDYVTPAWRPLNSRLDCSKIEKVFGVRRQNWRAALDDVLKELGGGRT